MRKSVQMHQYEVENKEERRNKTKVLENDCQAHVLSALGDQVGRVTKKLKQTADGANQENCLEAALDVLSICTISIISR